MIAIAMSELPLFQIRSDQNILNVSWSKRKKQNGEQLYSGLLIHPKLGISASHRQTLQMEVIMSKVVRRPSQLTGILKSVQQNPNHSVDPMSRVVGLLWRCCFS
jgi:hypothetical protein